MAGFMQDRLGERREVHKLLPVRHTNEVFRWAVVDGLVAAITDVGLGRRDGPLELFVAVIGGWLAVGLGQRMKRFGRLALDLGDIEDVPGLEEREGPGL